MNDHEACRRSPDVWRSRAVVGMVLLPSVILATAVAIWLLVFPPFSGTKPAVMIES